jgi:hypothetical protein
MGVNQKEGPKELLLDNKMMTAYDPKSTEPFMIFSCLSPNEFSGRLISKLSDEEVKAEVDDHSWKITFRKTKSTSGSESREKTELHDECNIKVEFLKMDG